MSKNIWNTQEQPEKRGTLAVGGRSFTTSPAHGLKTTLFEVGWPCMVDGSLRRELCDPVACLERCPSARCKGLRERLLVKMGWKVRYGQ